MKIKQINTPFIRVNLLVIIIAVLILIVFSVPGRSGEYIKKNNDFFPIIVSD